ncbi:MAG: hypothetical protein M3Y85_05205 [Bacteroidota bacterium]|nr:hypothetical protein [Bacteroidota bacterium]
MQGSKIRLSDAEQELFANAEVILTKNSILQKTMQLLNEVQENLLMESSFNENHFTSSPKISKGENYLGLPYVVLDYPRISKGDNLLFIRSFFWWGNFFSSTLQVSGNYKENCSHTLKAAFNQLSDQNYFIGVNEHPWVHHFGEDNYASIQSLSKQDFVTILDNLPHTKIAAHWPLSDWDSAANKLIKSWKVLAELVS